MERLKELEIEGEKVYLKKDILGYRIVNPIKIDGKINWINLLFGGKRNLVILIIYMVILLLLYIGIKDIMTSCELIAKQKLYSITIP